MNRTSPARKRLSAILVRLIPIGVVAVLVFYFVVNPASSHLVPKCAFKYLTGWECPGCGSQRMLHALLHGDLTAAWEANPFLLVLLPFLLLMAFSAATRERFPVLYRRLNSLPVIILVSVALVAWFILRNLL